jgi:hypothetical protein
VFGRVRRVSMDGVRVDPRSSVESFELRVVHCDENLGARLERHLLVFALHFRISFRLGLLI